MRERPEESPEVMAAPPALEADRTGAPEGAKEECVDKETVVGPIDCCCTSVSRPSPVKTAARHGVLIIQELQYDTS